MQPSYVVGVLDPSFIQLLGDGTNDGSVIGDPSALTEIEIGVIAGNLVAWKSPWQMRVDVPLLGGAKFDRVVSGVASPYAATKAIAAAYVAALLANPEFVDAITGVNVYAALPVAIANKTATYPAAGTARTFATPMPIYPASGTYVPWSNSNSLALAYATDQFL